MGCGICGIVAVYVHNPILAIYLFMMLLLVGIAVPVVNAATVDLYSTNSRYKQRKELNEVELN